jgi:hypothetical protein
LSRKSWADRQGIPTGVLGETYKGIHIAEANRATVWEKRKEGIEELITFMENAYTKRGVKAVIFGVHRTPEEISYAVFVQDGFITNV